MVKYNEIQRILLRIQNIFEVNSTKYYIVNSHVFRIIQETLFEGTAPR